MAQNKSFILKIPYFLATDAGSATVKYLLVSCHLLLAVSYLFTLYGTFLASAYCLAVWQFLNVITKQNKVYSIYYSFLLQRLVLCNIFVIGVFIYCSSFDTFNYSLWKVCCAMLAVLNLTDVYFTLKGFIGVAYINAKKARN